MRATAWCALAALVFSACAAAADFGSPGGREPGNVDEITRILRQDPYDLELLISFGTSKGGSAGHLALAIREPSRGDDLVYSANFYADRDPAHEANHYTGELMVRVPKEEYLFGKRSSLGEKGPSASISARSTSARSSACAFTACPPARSARSRTSSRG